MMNIKSLQLTSGIGWLTRESKIYIRSNNEILLLNVYRKTYH